MAKIKRLCAEHLAHEIEAYGDDGGAILDEDNCHDCQRHPSSCICADCSGAELTSDND